MPDNHSPAEGTIRDARPGEPSDRLDAPRLNLSVLNVSHERFRIIKTYAQGGLGVVSIAHDIELDRTVAVKEMLVSRPTDDDVQRFLLEARLTGQLDHPGIPPVYAIGFFEDGRPFYAMRLVDGVTLRSAVKEFHAKYPPPDHSLQRSMQLRQLIGAVVSVCNTLRFAHSKGVLHRDIKPSNIMLGEFGETLLMDWGLAKSQKQSLPYSELEAKAYQQRKRLEDPEDTGTGSVMGTPHYMSPEQAIGDVDSINQRSEVYSVGATLYSVLTGKPPFTGQSREEILDRVRRGDFQPPQSLDSRVPPELNAICMKAMALERGDRYADTGELARDIEHWLADESVPCYREPITRRWQRFLKAHQALVASLVVLMVTCFVGLILGTYLVSVKHAQAVTAKQEAEEASQKAEAITQQSRELLSRTFVTTFNTRIRNVPGTERIRLAVLEPFIQQFQAWSHEMKSGDRQRHELAQAIYERACIYNELNDVERAWADMRISLGILEGLLHSADHDLRNACMLDRFSLLAEMSKLNEELQGEPLKAEVLSADVYAWCEREALTNAQTAAYRYQLAGASLRLGMLKHMRGNSSEAFELLSRAASLYASLLYESTEQAVDLQMVSGVEAAQYMLLSTQHELAKVAWHMRDRDFAIQQSLIVESRLEEMNVTPLQLDAWLLKCNNQVALARFGALADSDVKCRNKLRSIIRELGTVVADRPNYRPLVTAQIEATVQLSTIEVFLGDHPSARANLDMASLYCTNLAKIRPHERTIKSALEEIDALKRQICTFADDSDTELVAFYLNP